MTSKLRGNSRNAHPGVVQPRGRLGVFTYNQKKNNVLRLSPQKQNQDTKENNDTETEKQPISDFPSPPIPIFSWCRAQQGEMPQIPNLATAAHGEITSIVIQKMKLCQRLCDFSDPRADLGGKATKKATLNELIDLYTNQKLLPKLTRECHQQLIETFAANVFRSPPRFPRTVIVSDEVTVEDGAWPHLHLVYILFIKFLNCGVEQRILQYQITPKFISNLFSVLDFPDERERVQVRSVIVTIYNKVPPQRSLLITITLDLLMNVPENLDLNAASHLLELFYQFTSNSPPPLSQQLIQAFDQVLLPLHLPTHCQRYFTSLVKCILLMIRKDARLTNNIIHFLIEHWPLTLDHKTELFLDEISQILQDSNLQEMNKSAKSLLNCVSIAVESPCMTLSEKALKFIQNNCIQNMIVEDPDPLLEIIFPPLFRVTCSHWQKSLQVLALNVMNTLMELTPDAFKRAAEQFKTNSLLAKKRKIHKYNKWIDVLEVSAMNDSTIDIDVVADGIKEFYNTEHRPQSRMSSSSASTSNGNLNNSNSGAITITSSRSTNSNNNNNGASSNVVSGRSVNSGRSNDNNMNMNSSRSNGSTNSNSNLNLNSNSNGLSSLEIASKSSNSISDAPKNNVSFENFSNPFKDLARDFESSSNYAGLFHVAGTRPNQEFPFGGAATLTVSEETRNFAKNKMSTGAAIDEKSGNDKQPDILSIMGGQNNNTKQPNMLSIGQKQNNNENKPDLFSLIEEHNNSNQPDMFSLFKQAASNDNQNLDQNNTLSNDQDISKNNNLKSNNPGTSTIIE